MKRNRKLISILLTLAMLATLLVPLAVPAAASGKTISSLNVVTTEDDAIATLGDLLITTVAGSAKVGNTITLRFPTDYKWDKTQLYTVDANGVITGIKAGLASDNGTVSGFVYDPAAGQNIANVLNAPDTYSGDTNAFNGAQFGVKVLTDNEIQIKLLSHATAANLTGNDGYLYVYTTSIDIPAGASGEIKVTATAPGSQGFPSGEAVVGKIVGGEVLVSVDDAKTFTDTSGNITLRFKETVKGSFADHATSMKLRLPSGFEWASAGSKTLIWGQQAWLDALVFNRQGRDLYIDTSAFPTVSQGGTYFSAVFTVTVSDESVAKFGDVKVTFSGETDAIPTELVIAKYNDMGSTVSAANVETVTAGKTEQEIGDIIIEEAAPGSLADERTITLALPAFAKWNKLPTIETEHGLAVSEVAFVGSDGRTLKYKVDTPSTGEPGKVTFKNGEVLLSAEASGKVTVEVAGTAGAKGTADVAEVVAAVTASASNVKEVKIGINGQAAGELTIVEKKAEAISSGKDLEIHLSNGAVWNDTPKIEVTDGDIDLDEGQASTDGGKLIIPVKATSTKAATIKISNILINVDRTVAEGDIKAKVKGLAVNEVNDDATLVTAGYTDAAGDDWTLDVNGTADVAFEGDPFPNVTTAASAVIAKVVTPAPGLEKKDVAFEIGSTTFKLNGVDVTMDVASYIKEGRTYLPLRYVAQALGVSDSNILWDGAAKKVTLIKGTTFVQLTIGSNIMMVNGMPITMDVAPEISSDRTCLPIRYVAQVLGASIGWDEATQTVTIKL